MANYEASFRTSYFKVTDEDKWKDLFSKLSNNIEDFSKEIEGVHIHCFGGNDYFGYDRDGSGDYEGDIYDFFNDLKEILPETEAAIYTEVGNERLKYLNGYSLIATKNGIGSVDLQKAAVEKAKFMLNNKEYETEMEY